MQEQGLLDLIPSLFFRNKVGSYILLLVGAVFLAFAGLHWWLKPPTESRHVPLGIIGAAAIGAYLFILLEERASRRFGVWLLEHQAEVESSQGCFRGHPITADTVLIRFSACVSLLAVTVYFASRPLRPRSLRTWIYLPVLSVFTLIAGWWGFPLGPVRTVQALGINLSGGCAQTAGDILSELRAEARLAADQP
jgi:hypothetical protein